MATTHNLLLLPGDGIGVEVMAEVERLIAFFNRKSNAANFTTQTDLVGGSAYDKHGVAITDAAMAKAQACDAIMFAMIMCTTVPSRGAILVTQFAAWIPPPPGMLRGTIVGLPGMCLPM